MGRHLTVDGNYQEFTRSFCKCEAVTMLPAVSLKCPLLPGFYVRLKHIDDVQVLCVIC